MTLFTGWTTLEFACIYFLTVALLPAILFLHRRNVKIASITSMIMIFVVGGMSTGCATRLQTETTSIVQVQEVQAAAVEETEIVQITINGSTTTTPRVYVLAEGFESDARRAAGAEGYDASSITTTTAWRNGYGQ